MGLIDQIDTDRVRKSVSRFFSNYGMLAVLILLCVYYSVVTLSEQNPSGAEAGRTVATRMMSARPGPADVFIAAGPGGEDASFTAALTERLIGSDLHVAGSAQGDPAAIRQSLEQLAAQGRRLDVIATTRDYARIVAGLTDNIPEYRDAEIVTPHAYLWPTFLLADNLRNVANQIVVIAIIAVGMTMVIITAGIDLSVGSLIALSAVVAAWLIRAMGGADAGLGVMLLASFAAIAMCGLVGVFSGLMVTVFQIPSFIATLAIMQIASGLAYIISSGVSISDIPESYVWLGRGADFFSLPNAVVLMIVIYALAHVLMTQTTLGRYIYAVGGNPEAARLSGIRVNWVLLFVYTVSAITAGIGGIIQASQLKSGAPTYGLMYELYVIAAVVVGGTSLAGGEGKILGTLIGAFIIGVIQNGMNLTGVESYTQKVVLGFVILGAVLLDMLKKRGWGRRKLATA